MLISNRVDKMMGIPFKEWPESCFHYMRYLSNQYGYCGEIAVTAIYHYLQAVEGMSCDDNLYQIDEQGRNWFSRNS